MTSGGRDGLVKGSLGNRKEEDDDASDGIVSCVWGRLKLGCWWERS